MTDASLQVIKASARSDPRIRAIRQERLGLVPALKRGLDESRCRLIADPDTVDPAPYSACARSNIRQRSACLARSPTRSTSGVG